MASFGDFGRDLIAASVLYEHHKERILEHIGKVVEEEAKDVIGTYRYGWPELSKETQDAREAAGISRNDPLLWKGSPQEGALIRDTISHEVIMHESAVDIGSESEIAAYQELGTSRIPPRSFLRLAAETKEEEIVEHIGSQVHIAMLKGLKLIP